MASQLKLRIRGPSGLSPLSTDPSQPLSDFLSIIYSLTSIPPDQQDLKTGFPPKSLPIPHPLSSGHEAITVSSLGIKSGETITVVSVPEGAPRTGGPASTSTSASASVDAPTKTTSAALPSASSSNSIPSSRDHTPESNKMVPPPQPAQAAAAPVQTATRVQKPQARTEPRAVRNGSSSRSKKNMNGTCVDYDGGYLVLRVVPDDNSCLFNAIALLLDRRDIDESGTAAMRLRMQVAELIRKDPEKWSEAMLGQEPKDYVAKILDMDAWGGAIELSILSDHFGTEICSIDIETGRMDRFGQEYSQRAIVYYSGIHYDAVTHTFLDPSTTSGASDFPPHLDFDTTLFDKTLSETKDAELDVALSELADRLRKERYFTNTSTFQLRCDECGEGLRGEKEAREHARGMGHGRFSQWEG